MRPAAFLMLLLGTAAWAESPLAGDPVQIHRGFFTEADLGVFFTAGGSRGVSTVQPFLQLGLGYDIAPDVELGVQLGLGPSTGSCFGGLAADGSCRYADNFTLAFVDLTAAYRVRLRERLFLVPRAAAGYTALEPRALSAVNAGAGLGVEYATLDGHFSIGADVLFRYVFTAHVPAFAVFPRVKYTF